MGTVVDELRSPGRSRANRPAPSHRRRHHLRLPAPQSTGIRGALHQHRPRPSVSSASHVTGSADVRHVRSAQVGQSQALGATSSRRAPAPGGRQHQVRAAPDDRHSLTVDHLVSRSIVLGRRRIASAGRHADGNRAFAPRLAAMAAWTRTRRVGKCRYWVPLAIPARRAISSRDASAPDSANATRVQRTHRRVRAAQNRCAQRAKGSNRPATRVLCSRLAVVGQCFTQQLSR